VEVNFVVMKKAYSTVTVEMQEQKVTFNHWYNTGLRQTNARTDRRTDTRRQRI